MQANPLLTIAVPTYNGEKTIRSMLDILLPQITEEVEVLFSDNCSTDATPQIIQEYRKRYPFIRCISNTKNIGADGNFLQCMLEAKGKFVMLISDDDILTEQSVNRIVSFLRENPDVSCAYLDSVAFRDHYQGIASCHSYEKLKPVEKSFCTTDKNVFFDYCKRLFGFTSSYIWSTERIHGIDNPQQYFDTYFLQAYILVLCTNRADDKLGLIAGPCVAVGEYGIIGNYDMAQVEGIYYNKMMEFAIKNGYPRKAMEDFYVWKIIHLCRNSIIKERAVGVKKTSVKNIFKATWRYPKAWVLYPLLLLPPGVCLLILKAIRKKQGRAFTSQVNRPNE